MPTPLSGTANANTTTHPHRPRSTLPFRVMGNWQPANTEPDVADNAGQVVLDPIALTRAAIVPINLGGVAKTIQIRLRYKPGGVVTSAPVVQVFGLDWKDVPERLHDALGGHELAMTPDPANDVHGGGYAYTHCQEVALNGNKQIRVGIKTAAVGEAFSDAAIEVRVVQ